MAETVAETGAETEHGVTLRLATAEDADTVAALTARLMEELAGELEEAYRPGRLAPVARRLLAGDGFAALLAFDAAGEAVALLTLSECAAVYALGRFGEIAEFYVAPARRSSGLGARMVEAAAAQARARGWTRLEVGAPDLPRWQRTVDFYMRCGFAEVGPRLKLTWDGS